MLRQNNKTCTRHALRWPSKQVSLFMRISSSPSHQPRVIVELTRREQQIQAEYQLGSGPEDTSWKEGRLCIIRNYVRVGCEHSVYPLFLHCSVFPFAPHIYLGHFQQFQSPLDVFLNLYINFVGSSSPLTLAS